MDANYHGRRVSTYMKCCKATTPALYETKQVVKPVVKTTLVPGHWFSSGNSWGRDVLCDSNAVIT